MAPTYGTTGQDPSGLQIISPVLTNVARQYRPQGFIYDQVTAPMQVSVNSVQYPIFDPTSFFQDPGNIAVADRAPTPEIDLKYSTTPITLLNYRLKTTISMEERQQANPALRLELSKTQQLLTTMALAREIRLAAILKGANNGGQFTANSTTPSVKWDQGTTGSPATIQQDIRTGVLAVYAQIGVLPNTIVMDYAVAYAIALDPTIQDLIKYVNGPAIVEMGDRVLPAQLWGLNVVIAKGIKKSSGKEGDALSLSSVWGNSVRLLYVDPNAQWGMPATAYSFKGLVRGDQGPEPNATSPNMPGDGPGFALVDRWQTPDPPVEHIRAWERTAEVVVAPDTGYEIATVLNTAP